MLTREKETERRSNIELLRILAMAGVIVLHYNNESIGGGLEYVQMGSINEWILIVLESVFICAVDLFIMISGYFLSATNRRSLGRVVDLLMQVSLYRLIGYAAAILMGRHSLEIRSLLKTLLPINWFAVLYAALYLFSPLVNRAMHDLQRNMTSFVLLGLLLIFSVWPTVDDVLQKIAKSEWEGLNPVSMFGDQRGYSIVNFTLCYIVGGAIRKADATALTVAGYRVKTRDWTALFILAVAGIVLWSRWDTRTARAYLNPLVILEAASVLMLFLKLEMKGNHAVNTLASAGFSVFLLHNRFLPFLNIKRFVRQNAWVMIGHIGLSLVAIILVCFVIDRFYNALTQPIRKRMRHWGTYCLESDASKGVYGV